MRNAVVKWKAPHSGCSSEQRRHCSVSPVSENMRRGGGRQRETIKGSRSPPSMAGEPADMPDSILLQVRQELWQRAETTRFFPPELLGAVPPSLTRCSWFVDVV